MLKHVKVIATNEEILGNKKPKAEIQELIFRLPLLSIFVLLSQISSNEVDENVLKKEFKETYIGLLNKQFDGNPPPKVVSERVYTTLLDKFNKTLENALFPQQSILQLWKWVLAYGDPEKIDLYQENGCLTQICYLALLVNDHLDQPNQRVSNEQLYAYLFSNTVFNNEDNLFTTIARTVMIYSDIAKNKELYNNKEFLDINEDFYRVNGYKIKEYIAVIYSLIVVFLKPKDLGLNWTQHKEEMLSHTKLAPLAREIINSIIVDYETISKWAKQELDSIWDFTEFRKKPLLLLENEQFLPFSLKLLNEQLFNGLFHKVRHIYPDKDTRFLSFFGKPFEKYTQILLRESINQSKLPYVFLPEFTYGKAGVKHSPDIMLRLNNKLLAIEVKSYRVSLPSAAEANVESIKKDTNKMIIAPLKQVHDRVNELRELGHESLKGIDEIYLMVVNQGYFPTLKPYEGIIQENLSSHFSVPIKGYYHLDIEEFEMLCMLIERKRPIFNMLNNKSLETNRYLPFKVFLKENSYHLKKNTIHKNQFIKIIDEIGNMLFDDFSVEVNKFH
ncbi:hypothetical protein SAMN05444673_2807 [Bacillus sp. OV166]|uniref:hypothetical protein n=1 Tax=Bacillus sp. OV166 TaxID=1882763 RepID=UPI000A2ABD81|nr:hypothetical protein [Bacillus sp. OV166]SMQ77479.1 hypothetical protein SAMN05444673_2807 [Bacillus sp. OV166]